MSYGKLNKIKSSLVVGFTGSAAFCFINAYFGNESFYKSILMPLIRKFDPETSHRIAITLAKYRIVPRPQMPEPSSLKTHLWNMEFSNPLGLAAGFDKHCEAVAGLQDMGFGFIEIGSVTPEPQEGNPHPRVFRLQEDEAVVNRYGFNSHGHSIVAQRLKGISSRRKVVGVNLGKNKETKDPAIDYVKGVRALGPYADYLVVNVSSPNTPGLRSLQEQNELSHLLKEVLMARNELANRPPLLVKIAPDLSDIEIREIASVITNKNTKVDGVIISNTTTSRPSTLRSSLKNEVGGLSGKPLKDLSSTVIRAMYAYTEGKIPIIGVGGISNGEDAYEKIKAGASLIQLYSSLVFDGPPVVVKVKKELNELLQKDGFTTISEAVGADHRNK